jgi:predicted RNase H-like HicB family nuclease
MRLTVEFDREADGRWIADIIDLPGVMAYGTSQEEALSSVKALALRVLAEKMEHGVDGQTDLRVPSHAVEGWMAGLCLRVP